MPQASNNQMAVLLSYGIELPKPQTQRGVTWVPKRKWSLQAVEAIIAYVQEGNGAGEETTSEERLALYLNARQEYEGRFVVETSGKDRAHYLVLCVVPETRRRAGWVAQHKGVKPSEVNPFTFEMVAEDEPPDYNGHILGAANLGDYRLADKE